MIDIAGGNGPEWEMKYSPYLCSLIVGVATTQVSQGALITDFNQGTELASMFRQTYNEVNTTTTAVDGLVRATSGDGLGGGTGGSAEVYIYDTTPADGTVKSTFSGPLSVSFDIRAAQAGSSLGIFLIDPNSESSSTQFLGLFNMDDGSVDRVRLFAGASVTSVGVGTAVTDSNITGNAGVNAGTGNFATMTLTYTQGANNAAVLQLTVGGLTTGAIPLANNSWRPEVEIGFRIYDSSIAVGGMEIDNFTVTPIPEPSASLLGMAGILGISSKRRRR